MDIWVYGLQGGHMVIWGYMDIWVFGYMVIWVTWGVSEYMVIWICRYMGYIGGIWLYEGNGLHGGYLDIWVYGYIYIYRHMGYVGIPLYTPHSALSTIGFPALRVP